MDFGEQSRRDEGPVNSAVLVDELLRVSQIVRLRLNDWLGHFELNDGRHSVLAVLARADQQGCSQAQLAERLGQSESNISTLIERMQRDGLVNRLRSDSDRRKRILLITAEGRSTLASVDASRSTWAGRLLCGISADDRPRLHSLLQQLCVSLELSGATSIDSTASQMERRDTTALAATRDHAELSNEACSLGFVSQIKSPGASASWLVNASDPQSPQFALQQMLLALSSSMGDESSVKDAA